jgi:hypothetical protein
MEENSQKLQGTLEREHWLTGACDEAYPTFR